ncbi:DUF2061 domain-containing protein [Candidatus Woesearchaeota archaeon]|nr:DUF2061 domain-containing protein [Candidatus Woesearchaeota archaeon]
MEQSSEKKDSRFRSAIKAFSYRVVSTLMTTGAVFALTGKGALALQIGGFEAVSKLVLYYLHERAWNRKSWRKKMSTMKAGHIQTAG